MDLNDDLNDILNGQICHKHCIKALKLQTSTYLKEGPKCISMTESLACNLAKPSEPWQFNPDISIKLQDPEHPTIRSRWKGAGGERST